jgi:imidazole glycerol-phosphate synthase subunit HisH
VSERHAAIVASGGANTASLQFALERLDTHSMVTADPAAIAAASHVILPGVGAAGDAMARLRQSGLDGVLPGLRQPVLGICLGMQLLFDFSEEGAAECLGIIPGRVKRFTAAAGLPVPHMGWNTLNVHRHCALLEGIVDGEYAYFVHSYALEVGETTVARTEYGNDFSACVQYRNFYGAQFHPERSAAVGARLLGNFLGL